MGGMMRVLEMVTVTILVVKGKEMINKGEMVGLALGWVLGVSKVMLWFS